MRAARRVLGFSLLRLSLLLLLPTAAEPTVAMRGTLAQRVVDDDAKGPQQAPSSACEREGATFVGSRPRILRDWQRPPKKVRNVEPTYPALPAGTTRTGGLWIGEILLDAQGTR